MWLSTSSTGTSPENWPDCERAGWLRAPARCRRAESIGRPAQVDAQAEEAGRQLKRAGGDAVWSRGCVGGGGGGGLRLDLIEALPKGGREESVGVASEHETEGRRHFFGACDDAHGHLLRITE